MINLPASSPLQRSCRMAVLLTGLVFLAGCAFSPPNLSGVSGAPPSPERPWTPPPHAVAKPAPSPPVQIPPDLRKSIQSWTLADIIDLALRNSSQTALTWAEARSAAYAYGSKRGEYFPTVNVGANLTDQQGATFGGASTYKQKSYGATADFSYLLFNFGGREASVAETRQALVAANFTHNQAIQSVIFQVIQAYYTYVTAQALLKAEEATVKEARTNLDAARERHKAGVATIADVLQAQTALSQAQLSLESMQGQIQTTRGALATAIGLRADADFNVEPPPPKLPVQKALDEVGHYLDEAQASRPDLAAARAQVQQAQAHFRSIRAERFPSLSANGTLGRTHFNNTANSANTYTLALRLQFPLFTGFSQIYDVQKARADEDAARARLETLEQTVALQVWTSYYDLKTAGQRVQTSEDLLKSATESHDVAVARYKTGVGSILDLLTAQAALENARAQQVQARADWFISFAQFARDTGTLETSEKAKESIP